MPEFHSERIFEALEFAAWKHAGQKRKGTGNIPYINHPIRVTSLLVHHVKNISEEVIVASLLHDTIEDTKTSYDEIEKQFGKKVADIVLEVTDDMTLSYSKRKQVQIDKAGRLSQEARLIKIADKASNILDILSTKLLWPRSRKIAYIHWAEKVIAACGNVNSSLEGKFKEVVQRAKEELKMTDV